MKIGIIVIFRNNVDEIDVEAISKNLSFLNPCSGGSDTKAQEE